MIELLLTLILLCLVGMGLILLNACKILLKFTSNLDELLTVINKLDRKAAIGRMTTGEALKEQIRISSIIHEWMGMFAKMLRKEIIEGFGGK